MQQEALIWSAIIWQANDFYDYCTLLNINQLQTLQTCSLAIFSLLLQTLYT